MADTYSALVFGATGRTGRHVLQALLKSPHVTRVGEYGRRITSLENITVGKEKLEQKIIDFEKLDEAGLQDGKWNVVYITLGTTRSAAGSSEEFEKIDREYVINAARYVKSPLLNSQRVVYLSAPGANSSSYFMFPRSKGLTEEGLANLGYSDVIVVRPSMLKGVDKEETKLIETIVSPISSFLSRFSSSLEIQIPTLAKALYLAGRLSSEQLPPIAQASKVEKGDVKFTLITNSGAVALGEAEGVDF